MIEYYEILRFRQPYMQNIEKYLYFLILDSLLLIIVINHLEAKALDMDLFFRNLHM